MNRAKCLARVPNTHRIGFQTRYGMARAGEMGLGRANAIAIAQAVDDAGVAKGNTTLNRLQK